MEKVLSTLVDLVVEVDVVGSGGMCRRDWWIAFMSAILVARAHAQHDLKWADHKVKRAI